jgi:hypothetical protein
LIGGPAEVQRGLAQLRANGVPLDAVWIYDAVDTTAEVGWPWPIYAPIPTGAYGDLQGFIARLQRQGLHVLGYARVAAPWL